MHRRYSMSALELPAVPRPHGPDSAAVQAQRGAPQRMPAGGPVEALRGVSLEQRHHRRPAIALRATLGRPDRVHRRTSPEPALSRVADAGPVEALRGVSLSMAEGTREVRHERA